MKMAVIGCGLIGGSMALSWKRAGIVDEVMLSDTIRPLCRRLWIKAQQIP